MAKRKETYTLFSKYPDDLIRCRLEEIRDDLRSGKIVEASFNMSEMCERSSQSPCGTVACIGGWLGLRLGLTPSKAANLVALAGRGDDHPLNYLFYEWDGFRPTPGMAADAIDRWLDGEHANPWRQKLPASILAYREETLAKYTSPVRVPV